MVVSGRAYSVLSHHDFFVLCPSALGFEWRWHRLAFGSRRGNSWESQDSGFSPHGVAGLTCTALALCFTVPRVPKAMSRFGRLATLESPFHSVFGGPRGRRKFGGCPIHSGTGYPPRSHRSAVSLVEARGHSALGAATRPLLPSTARWHALLRWFSAVSLVFEFSKKRQRTQIHVTELFANLTEFTFPI